MIFSKYSTCKFVRNQSSLDSGLLYSHLGGGTKSLWENLEKLNYGTSKTARFALETHFLEILPAYPLKSCNLFNFREGRQQGEERQQGEGAQQGGAFQWEGVPTGNVTPLVLLFIPIVLKF